MNINQLNTVALNIYALLLVIAVAGAAIGFLLILAKKYRLGGTIFAVSMLAGLTGVSVKMITCSISSDDLLTALLCVSGFVSSLGFVYRGMQEGQ